MVAYVAAAYYAYVINGGEEERPVASNIVATSSISIRVSRRGAYCVAKLA